MFWCDTYLQHISVFSLGTLKVSEDVRLGREPYSIDHQYSEPGASLKTHNTLQMCLLTKGRRQTASYFRWLYFLDQTEYNLIG